MFLGWVFRNFQSKFSGRFPAAVWLECSYYPADIYVFNVKNGNTRTMCDTCSKLTIKTPEGRHWRCSGAFIVNSEHNSHIFLVVQMFTVNKQMFCWVGKHMIKISNKSTGLLSNYVSSKVTKKLPQQCHLRLSLWLYQ